MSAYPWIKKANKVFTGILLIQALAAIAIGLYVGSFFSAAVLAILFSAIPLFLISTQPFAPVTRHAVGIGTQLLTALHINLAMGLTEVHFEIFTLLAFLSWYRDWRVFVSSVVVVAVHHIAFFIMQSQGAGIYIFEQGHMHFYILVLHAFFAVAEGAVLGVMAAQNYEEAVASLKLKLGVDTVLKDPNTISLAEGCAIDAERKSMFGKLLWTFRDTLASIIQSNTLVVQSLQTLNDAKEDVRAATEQSSTEVSMITTSMEEMTTTINDVAKRATEVGLASQQALENTEDAKNVINTNGDDINALREKLDNMASSVASLDDNSKQISDAMSSIEAVAEQTNLLALNAAIEAARAGEQGRGFAVVADEVRSLAGNTKNSTDQIKTVIESLATESASAVQIIQACVSLASQSVESAEHAQQTMNKLVDLINSVTSNITSVATAAEEQVATAEEINRSTVLLYELAKQNENAVEQSSNALASLNQALDISEKELKAFIV